MHGEGRHYRTVILGWRGAQITGPVLGPALRPAMRPADPTALYRLGAGGRRHRFRGLGLRDRLGKAQNGWWLWCQAQGCGRKRDLGRQPGVAVEVLMSSGIDFGRWVLMRRSALTKGKSLHQLLCCPLLEDPCRQWCGDGQNGHRPDERCLHRMLHRPGLHHGGRVRIAP